MQSESFLNVSVSSIWLWTEFSKVFTLESIWEKMVMKVSSLVKDLLICLQRDVSQVAWYHFLQM